MNIEFERAVAERRKREQQFDLEREKRELENLEKINDFINQHDANTIQVVSQSLIDVIEVNDLYNKDMLLQAFRDACHKLENIKFVYYMQLLRIAITGQLIGANMLDVIECGLLSKQEIIERLKYYRDCFSFERIKQNEN